MITISHFHFALIIFAALITGAGFMVGVLEILGREAESIAKPEPETLCTGCHLLFTKGGQSRAVATGYCLRCEAREILSAAKDVGKWERRNQPEDRRFMEGL